MAFKMKGSPMQRNFGVGSSPVKHTVTNPKTGTTSTEHPHPSEEKEKWSKKDGPKMKSPLEHKAAEGEISPVSGATAKQHNKTYGTPKHHDDPRKGKRKNKMENDKIKDPVHAAMLDPETGNEESGPQMKSPLEQYREQMFGKGKREKRKKYMSNKEYDEKYGITPEKKKDGNVITRGLRNIGKAIGNIKIKAGGRGGYEMGPGGRGNWRG